ncbi:Chaperone protein dnaJ A6 chloroplastic [Bienertia sinuspersici]
MASSPCGTTWAAQWGVRPILMSRHSLENKFATFSSCGPSKIRVIQSLGSSMFSPEPVQLIFNVSPARSPCFRRGRRFIVRAESDYYSILGVSRNASKSEIKSGELHFTSQLNVFDLHFKKKYSYHSRCLYFTF